MTSWTRCFVVALVMIALGVVSLILIAAPQGPDVAMAMRGHGGAPMAAGDAARGDGRSGH